MLNLWYNITLRHDTFGIDLEVHHVKESKELVDKSDLKQKKKLIKTRYGQFLDRSVQCGFLNRLTNNQPNA